MSSVTVRGLTDTHAHLCSPEFAADLPTVLERARQHGIERVVSVSENLADFERNLALAEAHPGRILVAGGLFPTDLDTTAAEALIDRLRQERSRLSAIGEVGLDHWKVKEEEERALQRQIFEHFIALSVELDLPLNVHSRSAGRQTIACLLEQGARKVQLHAFDGRAAKALPAIEAGYFFSVPPSVVRSKQKQKLVRRLPLDNLLLETDSPVLGPDREQRNEPANAVVSLQAIAELQEVPVEKVASAVRRNTERLYGIPAAG
ncbi:MAG: TatD family hydrolase [Acidobacteriota bacterium]